MNISIGAHVRCTDGSGGKLSGVVVDRTTRRITHLVVDAPGFRNPEKTVPVEELESSSPEAIVLSIGKVQLDAMPGFNVTSSRGSSVASINPTGRSFGYDTTWNFTPPYESSASAHGPSGTYRDVQQDVSHQNIGEGEVVASHGSRVQATDGYAGRVQGLEVEPDTKEVTHLIMRDNHLWGQREIVIPLDEIDRVYRGVIELKLDKKQLHELPSQRP